MVRAAKLAQKLINEIEADQDNKIFCQNLTIAHEHPDDVKSVAFSPNGTAVVTVSESLAKVWKHVNG